MAKKSNQKKTTVIGKFIYEDKNISDLKPHPRNYRNHPEDQIQHIKKSIEQYGIYRNVVVAKDFTILAGHGVVQAAKELKLKSIPVVRINLDPNDPIALKLVVGDNEISRLGEIDDRLLTEILKEIKTFNIDELIGTGFDSMMLANLAMVTRPESEIADFNAAAEWVGMPEYEPLMVPLRVIVSFENEIDRKSFFKKLGIDNFTDQTKSIWYPMKKDDDVKSIKFESKDKRATT